MPANTQSQSDIDLAQLGSSLAGSDTEGAKKLLQDFLSRPLSSDERAAIQADFVAAILRLENQIDSTYLEELQTILGNVTLLAEAEKSVKDKLDLLQVRASLR